VFDDKRLHKSVMIRNTHGKPGALSVPPQEFQVLQEVQLEPLA
jgi:hypothetical protein